MVLENHRTLYTINGDVLHIGNWDTTGKITIMLEKRNVPGSFFFASHVFVDDTNTIWVKGWRLAQLDRIGAAILRRCIGQDVPQTPAHPHSIECMCDLCTYDVRHGAEY